MRAESRFFHLWGGFFRLIWLGHEDAQDVVQNTVVRVFKSIGGFVYDLQKGQFKNWLCVVTRSVIKMHYRSEQRLLPEREWMEPLEPGRDPVEQIPDPRGHELEVVWDEEWHHNLLRVVLERVKDQVTERQFQMFHCYAIQEWSVRDVCRSLGGERGAGIFGQAPGGAGVSGGVGSGEEGGA